MYTLAAGTKLHSIIFPAAWYLQQLSAGLRRNTTARQRTHSAAVLALLNSAAVVQAATV
jgi:hypothetical protein